jgi:hypothetical protein
MPFARLPLNRKSKRSVGSCESESMTPLMTFLFCLAPASDAGAPPTDFAVNLRLASTTTHAPLSADWAMSYYQAPPLIGTPATVDSPTKPALDEIPTDNASIDGEPFMNGDPDMVLWHDWTMSDLSLEWGLATIGPGVLAPQGGGVSSRPGGGGGGGGGGGPQPSRPGFLFDPPPPTPVPGPGPAPSVEPVPEPSAIIVWLALFASAVVVVKRGNRLQSAV